MSRALFAILALSCATTAQDLIHYKFDSVGSKTIVNYANSSSARTTAVVGYGAQHGYATGKFGPGALAAAFFGAHGNSVDTGWVGPLKGSATFAFFLRNHYANLATARSGFVGRKGFTISTGGAAGGGLMMDGWGGPTLKVHFGTDLVKLVGWHHYAIVVDAAAKKATWYWNGRSFRSETIPGGMALAKADPLLLGRDFIDPCGSRWDMDEFRFTARAVSASEIMDWATKNPAAHGQYGVRPLAQHDLTVLQGEPVIGNQSYALQLRGSEQQAFVLGRGLSRVRFGTVPLPIDLGGGALWHTSVELFVPGVIGANGTVELPIPIPADARLDQAAFHTQAILLRSAGGFTVSNAIAHTIGY